MPIIAARCILLCVEAAELFAAPIDLDERLPLVELLAQSLHNILSTHASRPWHIGELAQHKLIRSDDTKVT